jgi:hypothetical protein
LNEESSPPRGQQLVLHTIRFAEIFRLEEFEQLESGLDKFYSQTIKYPHTVKVRGYEKTQYQDFINRAKTSILPGGWSWCKSSTFISKSYAESHTKGFITLPVRELPEHIQSISLTLHQILASSIVLIVTCFL